MVQNAAAIALSDGTHIKWGDIPTHLGLLLTCVRDNTFVLTGGPKWDELLSYKGNYEQLRDDIGESMVGCNLPRWSTARNRLLDLRKLVWWYVKNVDDGQNLFKQRGATNDFKINLRPLRNRRCVDTNLNGWLQRMDKRFGLLLSNNSIKIYKQSILKYHVDNINDNQCNFNVIIANGDLNPKLIKNNSISTKKEVFRC